MGRDSDSDDSDGDDENEDKVRRFFFGLRAIFLL
jgi:hypothetical protein